MITKKTYNKNLTKNGWLIGIDDVSDLEGAIKKSKKFIPKKYENKKEKQIINIIKTYIDKN